MDAAGDSLSAVMQHYHEPTRLEAFADGVFAIAITLLIMDLKSPADAVIREAGGFWPALAHLWPAFFGYAVSFLTIGVMWVNHHAMLRYIRRVDRTFLLANVVFLLVIAFVPFPTAVLSAHLTDCSIGKDATLFYALSLLVVAIAFNVVWRIGIHGGSRLGRDVHPDGIETITRRYNIGLLAYVVAASVALLSAWACLGIHIGLILMFMRSELPRGTDPVSPAAPVP